MLIRQKLIVSFALVLFTKLASAGTLVYVINSQQFGTVDLATGAFSQIGPNTPEGTEGLVPGPNGSLLTLGFDGNLDSINPSTGVTSFVGATGLGDCSFSTSLCGPSSPTTLGELGGNVYATDFANNFYSVNQTTGKATLIGATGIAAVPFVPGTSNGDGTVNLFDQAIFAADGKLYTTFDAFKFDFGSLTATPVIAPALYRIDPLTGLATLVGATDLGIGAVVEVNGTSYAFNDVTGQVASLDLTSGTSSFRGNFDPAAGVISGAAATPEPDSIALACVGLTATVVLSWRRRGFQF